MRRLYFSIVIAVIGSLFIISWGLDQLVAEHGRYEENTETLLYKQLVEGFSEQLNSFPRRQLEAEIHTLARIYQVPLTLEKTSNIALPSSLHSQLSQAGGLLLASESDSYLLRRLAQHPDVLIKLQVPNEINSEDNQVDLVLTSILYLGVCAIIILWLFPLTRRLYLLTAAAAKIGAGNFDVRVPSSQFSYIRHLENSFNKMAGQIETLVADNKILAHSLSHDIRTPMSCLRFGVEAALDTEDIDKKNLYIQRMEAELTRMEEMTSAFLEYAGMERKGFHLNIEKVNVNELIATIEQDFQALAEQYGIHLVCQLPTNVCYVMLDAHWCHRAIQNLISNAMQYASKNVHISLTTDPHWLTITIEDDGKGIPLDKLNVIFNPFIKLDADRSREQGHFGLGLAISAKVMDWHSGKICASPSTNLGGACFMLSFPLKRT